MQTGKGGGGPGGYFANQGFSKNFELPSIDFQPCAPMASRLLRFYTINMFNSHLKTSKTVFFVCVGDDTDEVVANESETENNRGLEESGQQNGA
jgi:hypothetical protein